MPTTNHEIAAAVAGLTEKLEGFMRLMDERDRQAMFQRAGIQQQLAEDAAANSRKFTDIFKQLGELMGLKNKGIGVLLSLGVIAGVVGGKIAAVLAGLGSWTK